MVKKGKTIIAGRRIEIKTTLARHQIVKKVVNTFIANEYRKKGKGVAFRYPVENLSNEQLLYIIRPGHKKNFDFKVDVDTSYGLGSGSHEEIALDLREKNLANPRKFRKLWQAIAKIYHCEENDVDAVLKRCRGLKSPFKTGAKAELLLKVIKWLFIMEDIVYWDNEGRAFLFNYFMYVAGESDKNRLKEALDQVKDPDRLKSFMKKCGINWVSYKR